MMFSKSTDLDDRYQHIFNSNPVVTLPRKTVVTLARNQVVTLKRNSVVTLDGISSLRMKLVTQSTPSYLKVYYSLSSRTKYQQCSQEEQAK